MKKQIRNFILAGLIYSLVGILDSTYTPASGQDLATYLSHEITLIDDAVRNELNQNKAEKSQHSPASLVKESYFLRRLLLRIRPSIGINIPEIAAFQIIPEAEFIWEKQNPDNWEIYRP
jgi:hypothetical protein